MNEKQTKQAIETAKKLEKELEPLMHQNAKTIVAPIVSHLENHLALILKEKENEKLTPEIIAENKQKEIDAALEAARKRVEKRKNNIEIQETETSEEVVGSEGDLEFESSEEGLESGESLEGEISKDGLESEGALEAETPKSSKKQKQETLEI
jgi:hypothetical protein